MRTALDTTNADGTFPIPVAPTRCRISTSAVAGQVRVLIADAARELRDIIDDWLEATEGVAELNEAEREAAFAEYERSWNELPYPVRLAAAGVACYGVAAATKGRAAAWLERACSYGTSVAAGGAVAGSLASPPTSEVPSVEPETSTGSYCTPWESFAQYGRPNHGKVTLYENGVSVTEFQGSREWASSRCAAALARLGQ